MGDKLFFVGEYIEEFNRLTGQSLPCCPIMQSSGLASHVAKHHPGEVGNISLIPDVISRPDYVGHNPKEPNSIELVKLYSTNILVGIKLDVARGYCYVASVYEISTGKLQSRIRSGRLKKFIPQG